MSNVSLVDGHDDEPNTCKDCVNYEKFSAVCKCCENCISYDTDRNDQPCCSCDMHSNWEESEDDTE